MPLFKWTIKKEDLENYYEQRMNRATAKALREYYGGFNIYNRRPMYQEELKDLELVYKSTLNQLQKQVEDCLPSLLMYMQEFVSLHKQKEAVREKLDALLAKSGRESQETCGDCDE